MRGESQSLKVSNWLAKHVTALGEKGSVVDLHEVKLPMFDVGETPAPQAGELLAKLEEADAFVFVSPEWNGMMSHGLINMLHYAGHQFAYKPVMLVGVSAGRGGTYPLEQMKVVGQKNRHYVISPENLVVSGVNDAFNDTDMSESSADFQLKSRADYSLKILIELSKALKPVRASDVIDLETFVNGV